MSCVKRPDGTALDIRWARREEAGEIARLFLISSDGLAAYIWGRMAGPGQSLEDVGAARYARTGVDFSYENCLLATLDGRIAGMVHAFPMSARPAGEVEEDPVLRPYAKLEDPGSLYISGLAVYARYRSQGVGSALMDCAEALALARALPRVSLICFERNEGALSFYRRRGFREIARRAVVPHPTLHYAQGDALLLVRDICGPANGSPNGKGKEKT
ncbi:GNAT family N-acetyltransferase [Chelativorans intermedius]|uniref:GNAT family N-acetyltransferase n=1 Tax=Chelativorans intermedius TaxID=515947 RepID=A0ABV6D5K1_9HYPH|nr:GNAT family N-acetyltransferase [Chelativorans intermedius]MCT8998833.1 GNAT family N-acetyltransferase [Chelativorans intermedius]